MDNFTCIAAAATNVGRVRKNNEDNFYFGGSCLSAADNITAMETGCAAFPGNSAFAVFDGMGGESYGEKASEIAACEFRDHFARVHKLGREAKLVKMLTKYYRSASDAVRRMSKKLRATSGTTAAVLIILNGKAYISNIGDSKIFRFSEGRLTQLTEDHTMAGVMIRTGVMTPEEANKTKGRNALTRFVGASSEECGDTQFYSCRADILPGDSFLLCSDGLTDMVSAERITEILGGADTSCSEKVSVLISEALENGGKDNCTVILVEAARAARQS